MWINYDGKTRSLAEPSVMRNLLPKNILHLIEERRIPLRRLVLHFQRLSQLLQQPPLVARHFRRNHHANTNVQIAAPAVRIRQAFALLAENLSRLRAFGNFQLFLALQRLHFDFVAQRRLRKTDRNFADQVRPAPLEESVLFHFQKNVKVARPAPVRSRFALPSHAQTRPGIHSRWHSHFQRAFALNPPHAAATRACILDRLPRSLARRASASDGEKSLRVRHLPAPAARDASGHPRARFRARALASFAKFVAAKLDRRGDARRSFFETQRHVVSQIRATLSAPATSAAPSSPSQHFIETEKIAKNILKFLEDRRIEPGIESAIAQPSRTITIVDRTLLLVRKHGISFRSRTKVVLGLFLLFRIAIGMPLQRSLAISGLDLLGRSPPLDAQNLVKVTCIAGRHRFYLSRLLN